MYVCVYVCVCVCSCVWIMQCVVCSVLRVKGLTKTFQRQASEDEVSTGKGLPRCPSDKVSASSAQDQASFPAFPSQIMSVTWKMEL